MYGLSRNLLSSTTATSSSPSTASPAESPSGLAGTLPFLMVTEWLELVTYRPGWRFELARYPQEEHHGHYVGRLWVRFKCDDTYGRYSPRYGDQFEVVANYLVPTYLCEDQRRFYTYLHRCITETEMHELDEWFKVGGRLVSNPHDPNDPEVWAPGNEKPKPVLPPPAWSFDESYMMKEEYFETQVRRQAGD